MNEPMSNILDKVCKQAEIIGYMTGCLKVIRDCVMEATEDLKEGSKSDIVAIQRSWLNEIGRMAFEGIEAKIVKRLDV